MYVNTRVIFSICLLIHSFKELYKLNTDGANLQQIFLFYNNHLFIVHIVFRFEFNGSPIIDPLTGYCQENADLQLKVQCQILSYEAFLKKVKAPSMFIWRCCFVIGILIDGLPYLGFFFDFLCSHHSFHPHKRDKID